MAAPAPSQPRILLVEDSADHAFLYRRYLARAPIELRHVTTGAAALAHIEDRVPAVVLLDLRLPDMSGMDILARIVAADLPTRVVVITAHGGVEAAVEAMKAGAYDFLTKPFSADRLTTTLRNALESLRLAGLVRDYERDLGRDRFHGLIGASPSMRAVYRLIERAASSAAPVFITGESGTGKELCARALHAHGPRGTKPFVALDCGAITADLMESEVFGHLKGAFTGAVQDRAGAARRADGGTLMLDEVCEMAPALQTKLLRFAQSTSFRPVGGDRERTVDVRLVCATNKSPWDEVEAGRFREDLYYRLHVVPIHMPPLRDRGEDVMLIARDYLRACARAEGKAFGSFDPAVEATFMTYAWPGNVRQLHNTIREIVVLHDGEVVRPYMLPTTLRRVPPVLEPPPAARPCERRTEPIRPLRAVEREAIEEAIALCDGSIARAADLLGVNASTIYRKRAAWSGGP